MTWMGNVSVSTLQVNINIAWTHSVSCKLPLTDLCFCVIELQNGGYHFLGSLCAYILVHGGPCLKLLSSLAYSLLVHGPKEVTASIFNVDEERSRLRIAKVGIWFNIF